MRRQGPGLPLLGWPLLGWPLLSCLSLHLGCAVQQTSESPVEKEAEGQGEGFEEVRNDFEDAQSEGSADDEGPHPLLDGRQPDPAGALPRLTYRHLGMHIGGPDNSSEAKRPWLADIEAGAEGLLSCYQLVETPERGGSYGVDLYVDKQGTVEVRASRQKLGGEDFDACMKRAFAEVPFHRPKVPTVLSYSVLFTLSDPGSEPGGDL